MSEFYTKEYWNKYFTDLGWKMYSNSYYLVYGKNKVYVFLGVCENFVDILFKILYNETELPKIISGEYTTIFSGKLQLTHKSSQLEEFDLIIRTVKDSSMVSLCSGIDWAENIIRYLSKNL
jgi:hypothetical protein